MNIIKIGAMWCPGCLIMHKVWKQVENAYPELEITSYDLDMDSEDVEKYSVGSTLPVIIFYKDGNEYKRLIGERKYEDLEEIILEMRNN
jgi:thiol-disulfide isomerase/thioredoxin